MQTQPCDEILPTTADSQPARIAPVWALRCVSAVALIFGIVAFIGIERFVNSAQSTDLLWGALVGLIGCLLVASSLIAFWQSLRKTVTSQTQAQRKSLRWLRCGVFPLAVLAVWGGASFAYETLIVVNQEYLHWFDFGVTFGGSPRDLFVVLIESVVMTVTLTSIGMFLLWFSFLYRPCSETVSACDNDRMLTPYSPPRSFEY